MKSGTLVIGAVLNGCLTESLHVHHRVAWFAVS